MAIGEETRRHVDLLVRSYLQVDAEIVEQPARVRSGSAIVNIRLVDAEPPVLRIFCPLVRDVPVSPELLEALNEVNAATNFIRLFWRDDTVYAADEMLAATLDLDELVTAVELLADVADHHDDVLAERFGGHVGFDDG